jgi:CTP-dependent riboflavin kinase
LRGTTSQQPDEKWIKELEDSRKVKFIYQELLEDGAFMTAQIAGNKVVYSVLLDMLKTR